ncbi:unknown protein [Synechococcus elongatus PCC 6301]|uniref:Uncharacterized protein n=2 Tax=Synechococcus elongatus TaxID=32046 RepID=A0A0H3K4D4_SYNP6|nr:unknown protein [Synechococcus elongatus PCC 6301]
MCFWCSRMPNRRREIRSAIAAALMEKTAAEDRVFQSRTNTLTEDELPAIMVLSRSEKIPSPERGHPPSGWNSSIRRTATIAVECVAQVLQDIDDVLDDLAGEVEAELEHLTIAGMESAELRLTETELDVSYEGSLPIGAVRLTYEVAYFTVYRDCADPYVDEAAAEGVGPIERSGAYPGGQILPGCPGEQVGDACPMPAADISLGDLDLGTYQPPVPPR